MEGLQHDHGQKVVYPKGLELFLNPAHMGRIFVVKFQKMPQLPTWSRRPPEERIISVRFWAAAPVYTELVEVRG